MIRGATFALIAVLTAHHAAAAASSAADDEVLPISIQVPFGFLVMHLPALPASFPEPKTWSVEAGITVTNNFILSEEIGNVLDARTGRKPFTAADFAAVEAAYPGRDLYYFDGETTRLAVRFWGSPVPGFTIGAEFPALRYAGGALDRPIEGFHDAFNLDQNERTKVDRNERTLAIRIGERSAFLEGGVESGPADPTFFMRWGPDRDRDAWNLAFAAGIKIPITSTDKFFSTGSPDIGAMFTASKRLGPWTFAFDASYVLPGNGDFLGGIALTPVAGGSASVGYRFATTSLWFQAQWEQSPLRLVTPTPLGNDASNITLGVRFPLAGRARGYFGLTENAIEYDNSSDIGLHVGVVWAFGP